MVFTHWRLPYVMGKARTCVPSLLNLCVFTSQPQPHLFNQTPRIMLCARLWAMFSSMR